eukprot:CAMPEP_0185835636 /NCGR_PEP_ID=MMETSP1353-20130828/8174_1 /TAXON_ID=1077150 /ORGANISM="Erythrolobus australicus, Strain CCMP3124" /LENGTH=50 /DNA_ID=CAMNT_0028534299 /DNA_START=153 /DNA_END=305 /DNA_ORIENTATION=-
MASVAAEAESAQGAAPRCMAEPSSETPAAACSNRTGASSACATAGATAAV